jgi:hypothetical protein
VIVITPGFSGKFGGTIMGRCEKIL